MLSQTDTSNKELPRWMDQLERNGSISSTPLTSPTIQHRNSTMAATQPTLPRPLAHEAAESGRSMGQGGLGTSRSATSASKSPIHNTFNRDAVVLGIDILRSIPSISSAVTQLLASYDQQVVQDALPGKGHITRRKSGRYNTTDTTLVGPQFRWPNDCNRLPPAPAYDEFNLAQWVAGQLSNALLIEDSTLLKNTSSFSHESHERRGIATLAGGSLSLGCLHNRD